MLHSAARRDASRGGTRGAVVQPGVLWASRTFTTLHACLLLLNVPLVQTVVSVPVSPLYFWIFMCIRVSRFRLGES